MASMIDFKRLVMEERKRFRERHSSTSTKTPPTTIDLGTLNNAVNKNYGDMLNVMDQKYENISNNTIDINKIYKNKTIYDFEVKNELIPNLYYLQIY